MRHGRLSTRYQPDALNVFLAGRLGVVAADAVRIAQPLPWWEDVILFGRHTMSFDRDSMNSVEVDRKDDGFYYRIHFRGDMLQEPGPLETREEAMTAGNRDLARLEAARSSR